MEVVITGRANGVANYSAAEHLVIFKALNNNKGYGESVSSVLFRNSHNEMNSNRNKEEVFDQVTKLKGYINSAVAALFF